MLFNRVICRNSIRLAALTLFGAALAAAATFGRVVQIGGLASDLALDEPRNVLYIANYTASRIDVLSLSDTTIARSINVAAYPNSLAHSFSHIFAGGYGAGYYSYKWAEVLSADAYSAFEESGLFDRDTGRRYRREILEVGGSRDAIDSFKAFRGREPSITALLRHQGIA